MLFGSSSTRSWQSWLFSPGVMAPSLCGANLLAAYTLGKEAGYLFIA
jgi:hypothetical protein